MIWPVKRLRNNETAEL